MNSSFTIALFNIQAGVGVTRGYWQYITRSWRYFFKHSFDVRPLTDFVREHNIDIIAFTETSTTLGFTDSEKLATGLSGLPHHAIAEYTLWGIFRLGNCLSTRYPLLSVAERALPSKGERRPLVDALVDIEGKAVRILVAHFSLLKPERRRQIASVASLVRDANEPLLIAADFNMDDTDELAPLIQAGMTKISLPTYPSWKPTITFDHIFINHKLALVASSVPRLKLSDHLPLVAEIRLT